MTSLSKFHSNGILTGAVDSCCLLCESHLRNEDDIIAHVTEPMHQKNLSSSTFSEKFKDDYIRKVKKGYFCEFCNLLLSTAAKVGLHVAEQSHVKNKGMLLLKRAGNAVIAYGNMLITEKAWNGIVDDTCIICNTEFMSEKEHKEETGHILNLVQNKLEFLEDKSIYRKIDDTSFHCLTCNLVLTITVVKTHFDETSHKTALTKSIELKTKNEKNNLGKPKETIKKEETKPEIKKPESKIEIKYVPPNEQPKKQSEKASAQQITDQVVFDSEDMICKALGAKNYITDNEDGQSWCLLCDWSLERFNTGAHIKTRHHQTLLKFHKDRLLAKNTKQNDKPKPENKIVANQEKESVDDEDKSKILESVTELQKQDIKINFESCTAMCKKCLKNIDFKWEAINKHIDEHNKVKPKDVKTPIAQTKDVKTPVETKMDNNKAHVKPLIKKKGNQRSPSICSTENNNDETEAFAKQNGLTFTRESSQCLVCNVKVPSCIINMQEHINGASHKNRVIMQFAKEKIVQPAKGKFVQSESSQCLVCNVEVPSCIKNMQEHINGASHKNRVIMQSAKEKIVQPAKETIVQPAKETFVQPAKQKIVEKPKSIKKSFEKKSLDDFVSSIVMIENSNMKYAIVNNAYCINVFSYLMVSKVDYHPVCLACELTLCVNDIETHTKTANHRMLLDDSRVVSSLDTEFVREIRPGVFHCGFCNILQKSWNDLQEHLTTNNHRECKTNASFLLTSFMSDIMQHRLRKEVEKDLFLAMLGRGSFFF